MRCHQHIVQRRKVVLRRCAFGLCGRGVLVPSVDHGSADLTRGECVVKCFFVNHRAAAYVHQHRIGSHGSDGLRIHQAFRVVGQRQAHHHSVDRSHEVVQRVERPALVNAGVLNGTAVGYMHPHAHGFGALCHGLGNVAETEQANRLRTQLAAQSGRTACPVGPALLAQVLVCPCQRHMAHQQGGDHVFGNGVFVAKAIGQGALRGQQCGVDRIRPCGRGMEQTGLERHGHAVLQLDAHHHIGAFVVRLFSGQVERIAQVEDLVLSGNQLFKALTKIGGVLAVENDFHGRGGPVVSCRYLGCMDINCV